ncbi:uncharacterized protein LOC110453439 [Mizuhopecten yessoensis]|uniref:uncharacterized protein LOC110453439 n=1 Tax=Mizuhopecten yessoensis TaxID=6573 RepID=UPI000B45F663|nr:uncharacterized protein LOC110453439 [Mizuhopecten yessoensis]
MGIFILFALSLVQTRVYGQMVSLSAPATLDIGQADLSLRCEFSDTTGISDVNSIQFYRDASASMGSEESKIVSVDYNRTISGSVVQWQDHQLELRGSASGYLDTVMSANLELNLTNTECNDSSTYRCTIYVTTSGGIDILNDEKTIDAITPPSGMDAITATAITGTINDKGVVTNETTLNITCSGSVGSPAGNIRWCWKQNDGAYMEVTSGVNESATMASGNCGFKRTSYLEYNVTNADTMTMFVCEVNGTYACGGAPYKSEFSITTEQESGDTNPTGAASNLGVCWSTVLLMILSLSWIV